MEEQLLKRNNIQTKTPETLFEDLDGTAQGLSTVEAQRRLEQYGPNQSLFVNK